MSAVQDILGNLPDPADTELPDSVRTPGRTWTTYPDDALEPGAGTVTVETDADAVSVLPMDAAVDEHPDAVDEAFFDGIDPATDRFTAYHARYLEDAYLVYIPEGTMLEEPITVHIDTEQGFFPAHIVVYAADGAHASVLERHTGAADAATAFTEVYAGRDAHVNYAKLNALDDALGYSRNHAGVGEQATMNWLLLSTGGGTYRNSVTTRLDGPRSNLNYRLGFLAAAQQHMDLSTRVIHAADNTRCDMDARGVLMDEARGIYKGVQEVKENAEGTQSFQDEKTVLVGDDCEADTTPQLQIDNNDVEATHAATTGHIDEEDLFYLTSRGVTEAEAQREVVTGMFDDLIADSAFPETGEALHDKIAGTLGDR